MTKRLFIRAITTVFPLVIFSLCAWYLYKQFKWHEIASLLRQANINWLVLGGGGACVSVTLLRACRWLLMVRSVHSKISFLDVYLITGIVVNLSVVTPSQLGEAFKIELLKQRVGVDRVASIGAFFVERIIDIVIVAGFGIFGLWHQDAALLGFDTRQAASILLGIMAFGIISVCLLLWLPFGGRRGSIVRRLVATCQNLSIWLGITPISIATWLCAALGWKLSLLSIGVDLSMTQVLWLMSGSALSQIFSLIPGGIGIGEIVIAKLMGPMGYDAVQSESSAIILRCITGMMILYGMMHSVIWMKLHGRILHRERMDNSHAHKYNSTSTNS